MALADPEQATNMLRAFIAELSSVGSALGDRYNESALRRAQAMEVAVRRIIDALGSGVETGWKLESPSGRHKAIGSANQALGVIATQESVDRIIGPQGPRLAADSLHPVVWKNAVRAWDGGDRQAAVQRAAAHLETEIATRTGRTDLSGKDLMGQVFSAEPPKPGAARLRWPGDPANQTVRSMMEGIRSYAIGVMQAIRNPATHLTEDPDGQHALEQLAALSLLARWADECVLENAPATPGPQASS